MPPRLAAIRLGAAEAHGSARIASSRVDYSTKWCLDDWLFLSTGEQVERRRDNLIAEVEWKSGGDPG